MLKINYPPHDFRIKTEEGKEWIFDVFRKKWIRLTPEEWVRQNTLQYLLQEMKYPSSLIAIEKEIQLGELKKRFDILVYKASKPWMVIECKELNVQITENVLKQVLNYNIALQASFLLITNGKMHYGFDIRSKEAIPFIQFPGFEEEHT
jgi:hypothetical protein